VPGRNSTVAIRLQQAFDPVAGLFYIFDNQDDRAVASSSLMSRPTK
jgi:hypothetical protein